MNLLHNKPKVKTLDYSCHVARWLYAIFIFTLFLPSCINEDTLLQCPDNPQNVTGDIKEIDLGGYISVRISDTARGTRGDNSTTPSDYADKFNDGIQDEYRIATGSEHHFAIIYQSGDDKGESTPLAVVPFSLGNWDYAPKNDGEYSSWDNVTLVAKTIVSNNDFITGSLGNASNKEKLENLFNNNLVFFLINFDKSQIYNGTDSKITVPQGSTNSSVLLSIKRNDYINNFFLKDYKITLQIDDPTDGNEKKISQVFFTMSSSVFVDNGKLNYGNFYFRNANLFDSEEEASQSSTPTLSAYVERVACKFTIKFDVTNTYNPDTSEEEDIVGAEEEDGDFLIEKTANTLPIIHLNINKYTGWETTGNGYAINSEPVPATIRIMGYGISNTEKISNAMKRLDPVKNYYNYWNDNSNYRSYWSEDPHYTVAHNNYPHQYRLALDHDSIVSYHKGEYEYDESKLINGNPYVTDEINGNEFRYYFTLGTPKKTFNSNCVLNYNSYNDMLIEGIENKTETQLNALNFYSLENTYYDSGMDDKTSTWLWPNSTTSSGAWFKEPYSTATCLIVLAELNVLDYNRNSEDYKGDGTGQPVCYRGQNNIYYFSKEKLLESKIGIFSKVMLHGGNAGINILHGQWDRHSRWDDDDEDKNNDTHLDQVAYAEGSVLWIAEYNENGYLVRKWEEDGSNMDLIPAEISGGDGQRLIAPAESVMGKKFKYFLSPVIINSNGNEDWADESQRVEISYNHLVALIHKMIGPIDVFENGYMYYAIPIPHSQKNFVQKGENASFYTLGKVGVVRNNWYDITIEGFSSIGTPVDDPNQPIVPVMDIRRSYLRAGVRLMNWHTIQQDNVPMM